MDALEHSCIPLCLNYFTTLRILNHIYFPVPDVSTEICQQGAERNDEDCEDSRHRRPYFLYTFHSPSCFHYKEILVIFDSFYLQNLQDEMMDMMDVSNEIQETLGRSYNVPDDIDEDELMGGKL